MSVRGSGYIGAAFDHKEVKKIIESFKECLKDKIWGDFDTIACLGTSGLVIAPILALKFKKKLLVVRKDKDNSHANGRLEGHDDSKKYIVIDDFVCSGSTLENIITTIEDNFHYWCQPTPTYVGCYFWTLGYREVSQKVKMPISRYRKLCENKVFAQRIDVYGLKKYGIDTYVEPEPY